MSAESSHASLPGFTLPGDVSASNRFYTRDIVTEPAVLEDGHVRVPTGPGLGVEPSSGLAGVAGLHDTFLAVGAYLYHRAAAQAPDRYAPCAKMDDPAERERCRGQIDFALSAGL